MGSVPDTAGSQATFASFREPAWHGLGEVFTDEVTDYAIMLKRGHLDGWDIHFRDVEVPGVDRLGPAPLAVVRTDPLTNDLNVMGYVGGRYEVVTNESAFAAAQGLKGGRWETAGAMSEGAVVFGSYALERETVIDPTGVADVVRNYILVSTSHDGSSALTFAVTPVRVVCENTLNMALSGTKNRFSIRHTKSADERIKDAQEALGLAHKHIDNFEEQMERLIRETMTKDQFFKGPVERLFPKPDEANVKGALTKWETRIEGIATLWNADTNDLPDTQYKALNVLTEAAQWGRKVRAGNTENFFKAGAGFDAAANKDRQAILTAVTA